MRKILLYTCLWVALAALPGLLRADTLIMKDGSTHEGEFVSGTSRVITFRENGTLNRYGIESIDVLQFGPVDHGASAAPQAGISADANGNYPSDRDTDQQQAPQQASGPAADHHDTSADARVIPSGSEIAIRTNENINSRTARVDQTFGAQVDQDVLDRSGQVLIPRGADATLVIKQINNGGSTGTPELTLDVQSVRVDGQRYLIDASDVDEKATSGIGKNKRTGQMVGGGAVLGTIIGAIAGGGKGAAVGAVGGAAAGAAAEVMTKGKDVRVPSETVLRFRIDHPVHLRPWQ